MSDDWDFAAQRADTEATLAHLAAEQDLAQDPGTRINLDIFLVAGPDADQGALERALAMFGYRGEATEDEEAGENFTVTAHETALTLEAIWEVEERITRIALPRGFTPDGWGFWEP